MVDTRRRDYVEFCRAVVSQSRGTSAVLEAEFEGAREMALLSMTARRVDLCNRLHWTSLALALPHEGGNDQRREHNKRQPDPSQNVIPFFRIWFGLVGHTNFSFGSYRMCHAVSKEKQNPHKGRR
jgi:hypothetical protein